MTRFRKKPVEIEARRLDLSQYDEALTVVSWCGGRVVDEGCEIDTLEGTMLARDGDWIIKGVSGEFYPCKPDIFEATYEPVLEGNSETLEIPKGLAEVLADAVNTDGAHHKQWYLEHISGTLGIDLPDHDPGIAP